MRINFSQADRSIAGRLDFIILYIESDRPSRSSLPQPLNRDTNNTNKKTCQQAGLDVHSLSLFLNEVLVFFVELLDPTFRIDDFLGTRKKGMASGADLESNGRARGFRFEHRTAGTSDFDVMIFGMDRLFQDKSSLILKVR